MDELDLSDLTDRDRFAPEPGGPPPPRRRRPVVLLLVVVAVLAVGALVVRRHHDAPDDAFHAPVPQVTRPAPNLYLTEDDRFDPVDGQDPLLASEMGDLGQAQVSLTFTPTTLDLGLASFCYQRRPGPQPDEGFGSDTNIMVNGHSIGGDQCSTSRVVPGPTLENADDQQQNRDFWAGAGVKVGKPSTVDVTYRPSGGRSFDPRGRLGVGIYELTGTRVPVGDVRLRLVLPHEGHDYRLHGYESLPASGKKTELRVPTTDFDLPVLAYAVVSPNVIDGTSRPLADLASDSGTRAEVPDGTTIVPVTDGSKQLRLTSRPGITASMVLAWYALEPATGSSQFSSGQ